MYSKKKLVLTFLFYIVVILLFTKIDYRFIEEFTCCQDDHDYYAHSETIAIDFDLNYDNQFIGFEKERFYRNGITAPKGFIGSGLLASPFLFVGNLFENIISNSSTIFNYRILFYSLSSIFYFYLSIYLINTSLRLMKIDIPIKFLFLLFMGSGVAYYAFERYSMTHVYEVFTICLVIFSTVKFYTSKSNLNFYSFLIPVVSILAINVRWVNYQVFFIPFLIKFLFKDKLESKKYLLKNKYFYFSYILSTGVFLLLNKHIYGFYTFNPVEVYGNSGRFSAFMNMDLITLFNLTLTSMFKILFSQEFGIFWFSPIIFSSLIMLIFLLLSSEKSSYIGYVIILLLYGLPFSTVVLWQSTASSYGYRYLFSLLPISILIYGKGKSTKPNIFLHNYLLYFSIFATLSILFFETTPGTSLSQNLNSFNVVERFSQPEYLKNYIASFKELDSYLKIFTTSFLGVLSFKILSSLFSIEEINKLLENLNLPVQNSDFQNFLNNIELISFNQIMVFSIILIFIVLFYLSQILKQES